MRPKDYMRAQHAQLTAANRRGIKRGESAYTYGTSFFAAVWTNSARLSPFISKKKYEAIKKIGKDFSQDCDLWRGRCWSTAYLGHL